MQNLFGKEGRFVPRGVHAKQPRARNFRGSEHGSEALQCLSQAAGERQKEYVCNTERWASIDSKPLSTLGCHCMGATMNAWERHHVSGPHHHQTHGPNVLARNLVRAYRLWEKRKATQRDHPNPSQQMNNPDKYVHFQGTLSCPHMI